MDQKLASEILHKIRSVKVAVYGDFCLDVYWIMDPDGSEISVETGIKAESVERQYYSPGGASNVVANLAALEPAALKLIGVTGNDIFGRELRSELAALHADLQDLFIQEEHFNTYTFVKKYVGEKEQPRIDFGLHNVRSKATDDLILEGIERAIQANYVLIINQQVPGSINRPEFIDGINKLSERYPDALIMLDSRHYSDHISHVWLKTNYTEIARACGMTINPGDYISLSDIQEMGRNVYKKRKRPVIITCGERGIITIDEMGVHHAPGLQFMKKLDPVGAGDSALSALALAAGAGYSPGNAAELANLAAGVSIQKLLTTGTATPEEILEIARDPDFRYNTDLAESKKKKKMIHGTMIEVCEENVLERTNPVKHVVLDHDGTVSTLRTGWEGVMESYMIRAITGCRRGEEGDGKYQSVRERVREYIALSAGIRTILQMKALTEMVMEFNLVPGSARSDEKEHKRNYLKDLMQTVQGRLSSLEEGKMNRDRYIIPGAIDFIGNLQKRGMTLYLASGTDEPDVRKEARILGYDKFFNGGIYGSRDDMPSFSKKILFERIIKDNGLKGEELMVCGDGPVEIRECRKRGGLAIGLATTEDGSGKTETHKRRRLIMAGAHLIMPDFREGKQLLGRILK